MSDETFDPITTDLVSVALGDVDTVLDKIEWTFIYFGTHTESTAHAFADQLREHGIEPMTITRRPYFPPEFGRTKMFLWAVLFSGVVLGEYIPGVGGVNTLRIVKPRVPQPQEVV